MAVKEYTTFPEGDSLLRGLVLYSEMQFTFSTAPADKAVH